jgi:hypothetical protein
MGWGRTLLLGDIGNRLDIDDVEREVADLRKAIAGGYRNDQSLKQAVDRLIEENAEIKLYLAAVIRLLIAKGSVTKQEMESIVAAVDAEDGCSDGKFNGKIVDGPLE